MTALQTTNGKTELAQVSDQTRKFVAESLSASTLRAYQSDLRIFVSWCDEHNLASMPASVSTVADFLSDQAENGTPVKYLSERVAKKHTGTNTPAVVPSSLVRRIAAIKWAHEVKGFDSPTSNKLVASTLKGIKNNKKHQPAKKEAATAEKIIAMLTLCDTSTLSGKRDKALLLIGFAGAFRRSELAALTMDDIQIEDAGIRVTIRSSKTDQDGQGQEIVLPNGKMNIIAVLRDWLSSAGIESGPLFRGFYRSSKAIRDNKLSGRAIADIVKAYAMKAGLNPEEFAGHSLRSGFITSAAEDGADLFKIMDQSRHKTVDVVRGYVRSAEAYKNHAGGGFL